MDSIEFGKKCRPYNIRYREIFGYVPCRDDYHCTQEQYFEALLKAIETQREVSDFVPKRKISDTNLNRQQLMRKYMKEEN